MKWIFKFLNKIVRQIPGHFSFLRKEIYCYLKSIKNLLLYVCNQVFWGTQRRACHPSRHVNTWVCRGGLAIPQGMSMLGMQRRACHPSRHVNAGVRRGGLAIPQGKSMLGYAEGGLPSLKACHLQHPINSLFYYFVFMRNKVTVHESCATK